MLLPLVSCVWYQGKWLISSLAAGAFSTLKRQNGGRNKGTRGLKAMPVKVELSSKLQSFLETAASGTGAAPGKGGNVSVEGIYRAEAVWQRLKSRALQKARGERLDPPMQVVKRIPSNAPNGGEATFDVAVCGGTLGILVARSLQNQGFSVCVVERGVVQGRDQEWNVSCEELEPLVKQNIVSQEEVDQSVESSWPKSRVGFEGTHAVEFQAGALNAGISPRKLVEAARGRFEEAGGKVIERTSLETLEVYDDGVLLKMKSFVSSDQQDGTKIRARLVVDAMGSGSPIVQQARKGAPPDAACLVVGTMASGYSKEGNKGGDYLFSQTTPEKTHGPSFQGQAFWEAFPSANGGHDGSDRTTYFFTYVLPGLENLPSIPDVFEEYIEALPDYQQVSLEELKVQRALCASFVAFRDSPLQTPFDRILQVGDAAGIQSPLSFGGFGALCRHLPRLEAAISEALKDDLLGSDELSQINPYLPNLAMQWSMYRSIAKPPDGEPEFVNRMMGGILSAAERCGQDVMMPILQDVFTLSALVPTLSSWLSRDPGVVLPMVKSMGTENVFSAVGHLSQLAWYTFLSKNVEPVLRSALNVEELPAHERFQWHRRFEAWRYGSGLDYESPK